MRPDADGVYRSNRQRCVVSQRWSAAKGTADRTTSDRLLPPRKEGGVHASEQFVEDAVARYYGHTVSFKAERLLALQDKIQVAFRGIANQAEREAQLQRRRINKLRERQRKLVDLHLAGAVPIDVLGEKQADVSRDLRDAADRLKAVTIEIVKGEVAIKHALELAADSARAYAEADPQRAA